MKLPYGNRAQQEAGHQASSRHKNPRAQHEEALNHYLELESREHPEPVPAARWGSTSRSRVLRRSWLSKGTAPVRHEHVTIAGRSVEITEDAVGVVELHLE